MSWSSLLVAFALGSIPCGFLVGRLFFKTDLRVAGSGNIGAANALRTLGTGGGIAVLLLDGAKGAAAVLFAAQISSGAAGLATRPLAALGAVLGHCYSPWLGFRGGKGVATFLGALAALEPPAAAIFIAVWLLVVLRTGFASLGSLVATFAVAVFVTLHDLRMNGSLGAWLFVWGAFALIVWRHRENIVRLRSGAERRLNLIRR